MKDDKRKEDQDKKTDEHPPVEILDNDVLRPETTPDIEDREEDFEKFKSGELGAEQFRYNDDGTPKEDSED